MIAKLCETSEMTIRRDFDFWKRLGLLARTHGQYNSALIVRRQKSLIQ